MKIEHRKVGSVDVLTPNGALVDQDATDFIAKLLKRLQSPNPRLAIAMQDVPYMDSEAIEGLAAAADDLRQRAGILNLVLVPGTCREAMELTGVADRFRFFEEVQDVAKSYL